MPTKPILSLTSEQLSQVPEYLDVREPLKFDQGDIHAIIDPRRLEVGVPLRSDLLVLQMLKEQELHDNLQRQYETQGRRLLLREEHQRAVGEHP